MEVLPKAYGTYAIIRKSGIHNTNPKLKQLSWNHLLGGDSVIPKWKNQ